MPESIVPAGTVVWGIQLPVQTLNRRIAEAWEPDATPADLADLARGAEAAGALFVGVCDHLAIPKVEHTAHMTPTWFDTIATLGYLAASTSRVRLLSVVWIAAMRHPLMTASAFATLDHLSGGRAVLGVGAGHLQAEFEALGIDFATRGARLDEVVDAVRHALDHETTEFHGEFFDYENLQVAPRPVQAHLPIWIGGGAKPALRRVAEKADGWIPQGQTLEQTRECVDYIRRHRDAVRPDAVLDLGWMPTTLYVGEPSGDLDPTTCLSGSPERIADALRVVHELGCNVLHLRFRGRTKAEYLDQLAAFGRDVAPLVQP